MTLIYLKSSVPDALEQKAMDSMESPSARNAKRWKGETERCDMVASCVDSVLEAYKANGIKTQKIAPKAAPKPKRAPAKAKK